MRPEGLFRVALAALMAFGLWPAAAAVKAADSDKALVVYLVRHGEKAAASEDPPLTPRGLERARLLANILRSEPLDHVHSSDYRRTRETATPTAEAQGLAVELYDPRDLPALVDTLVRQGGRHLVVGHSNTTPAVVELLGGSPGPAIDEAREYDRLYIVTRDRQGDTASILLRYGEPFIPE
jgi:2,3-bisphosphoglycerate-dependent phosphoglycerate mutase